MAQRLARIRIKELRAAFAGPRAARALALALALLTFAVYAPVGRFEFLNFDDGVYVVDNPHVRNGLTLDGVRWAFTQPRAGNWHPVTWLSHMLDCQLFGLWPGGPHLVNAAIHAASGGLLLLTLSSMTGALGRSAAVASLFALHPLRVESVAWVSERKDVLPHTPTASRTCRRSASCWRSCGASRRRSGRCAGARGSAPRSSPAPSCSRRWQRARSSRPGATA
jgi:hypothetical protein